MPFCCYDQIRLTTIAKSPKLLNAFVPTSLTCQLTHFVERTGFLVPRQQFRSVAGPSIAFCYRKLYMSCNGLSPTLA